MAKTVLDVLRLRLEQQKEIREDNLLSGDISSLEHYKLVYGIKFGLNLALFELEKLERDMRQGQDEELEEE